MKKRKVLIATTLSLVFIIGFTVMFYPKEQPKEVKLREYKVSRGDITVGVETDAMANYKKTDYGFDVEVTLGDLPVMVGDMVKQGDILAEISVKTIEEELKKFNLEYQKALIHYNNAKDNKLLGELQAEQKRDQFFYDTYDENFDVNIEDAQIALREAKENRDQIYAQLKDLEEQLKNDPDNTSLINQVNEKKQEYQRANLLVDRAELALKRLRAERNEQLEKKETGGSVAKADYETTMRRLENDLKLAELELNRISNEIAKLKDLKASPQLKADKDGVVLAVNGNVGDRIAAYKPVVSIGESSAIQVEAMVSQNDIGKISVDQVVEGRFEAYPDDPIKGTVTRISYNPEKNNTNVSYKVYFTLEASDIPILNGMTGEATFIIKRKENILRLSNKAIYFRDGKQYVKLLNEDGTVSEVLIKTGFSDGKTTEIVEGLSQGQTVVVEG